MSEKVCPRCGAASTGNFCTACGASLDERFCNQCGSKNEPGARFCNECGAPVAGTPHPVAGGPEPGATPPVGAAAGGRPGTTPPAAGGDTPAGAGTLAWWITGALMVALILFVAYPMVVSREEPEPAGGAAPFAGGGGGGAPPDLSSMTPREAADRLFERVMVSVSAGDSAQAQQFLPMAVSAYEMARPLDSDGLFHLSMLQRTAGDTDAALTTAREGLEDAPDHLLLLSAAAAAAAESGQDAVARGHYERLLDVWEAEQARGRPEYLAHDALLPEIRAAAEGFLSR